jgi:hypothetical protein
MRGDFSRGHQPDRKRNQEYRRVLMQQGRVLLDSDVAALVDAEDAQLRELANDLGCPAGSPDLGYYITLGPLLAVFPPQPQEAAGLGNLGFQLVTSTPPSALPISQDYHHRYPSQLGKYGGFPSLHLDARCNTGTVTIQFRQPLQPTTPQTAVRLWVLTGDPGPTIGPQTATFSLSTGGPSVSYSPNSSDFTPIDFPITDPTSSISITMTSGQLWIGLIEGTQIVPASPKPKVPLATVGKPGAAATVTTPAPVAAAIPAPIVAIPSATATPAPIGTRLGVGGVVSPRPAAGITGPIPSPVFSVATGRYYLDGLVVHLAADATYPGVSYFTAPDGTVQGAPPTPQPQIPFYVVYLEAWERLITRVEDPGIFDNALSGPLDTAVRTKAMGQVKIANLTFTPQSASEVDGMFAAIANMPGNGGGLLTVNITSNPTLDPCAIPTAPGYTGADNRLYRIEVHQGGLLGTAVLKWSRRNGAELTPVSSVSADGLQIALPIDSPLQDGDLVELASEATDLGDATLATLARATPTSPVVFTPPERLAGTLYYVKAVPFSDPSQKLINLLDVTTKNPVALPANLIASPVGYKLKLRRWNGMFTTNAAPTTQYFLEDGIHITLGMATPPSPMRVGDYWQYEARRLSANQPAPTNDPPHGPERHFAQLGVLAFSGDSNAYVTLPTAHRFAPLCELSADNVAYDGGESGSTALTVQEALDELFKSNGCCTITLSPNLQISDDTPRLQQAICRLPVGGVLCLRSGVYHLKTPLTIDHSIEIRGCPDALLVDELGGNGGALITLNPDLNGDSSASFTMSGVSVIASGLAGSSATLVQILPGGQVTNPAGNTVTAYPRSFFANDCIFINAIGGDVIAYVPRAGTGPLPTGTAPVPNPGATLQVRLDRCLVMAGTALDAGGDILRVEMHDTRCLCVGPSVNVLAQIQSMTVARCIFDSSQLPSVVFAQLTGLGAIVSASSVIDIARSNAAGIIANENDVAEGPTSITPKISAVAILQLLAADITDCTFVADICVRTSPRDLRLAGNLYFAATGAVLLSSSQQAQILGERIFTNKFGIYLGFGALDVTIADCRITRFVQEQLLTSPPSPPPPGTTTGINVGEVLQNQAAPPNIDVRILRNYVATDVGIRLTAPFGVGLFTNLFSPAYARTEVVDNTVIATTACLATARIVGLPGEPSTVSICDNRFEIQGSGDSTSSALTFFGDGAKILGNRIIANFVNTVVLYNYDTVGIFERNEIEIGALLGKIPMSFNPTNPGNATTLYFVNNNISGISASQPITIVATTVIVSGNSLGFLGLGVTSGIVTMCDNRADGGFISITGADGGAGNVLTESFTINSNVLGQAFLSLQAGNNSQLQAQVINNRAFGITFTPAFNQSSSGSTTGESLFQLQLINNFAVSTSGVTNANIQINSGPTVPNGNSIVQMIGNWATSNIIVPVNANKAPVYGGIYAYNLPQQSSQGLATSGFLINLDNY